MNYEVIATLHFKKEYKRLLKKYPSLSADIEELGERLQENPKLGKEVFKNCFKIRFAITSKGKGKSGGGRLITLVKVMDNEIYLVTVYDKSETPTVTEKRLKELLDDLK
jgi:mRNA-degrading endonuclease RelE of RelBE toxin-antitoxin system